MPHGPQVQGMRRVLCAALLIALFSAPLPGAALAPDEHILWRLAPSTHYSADVQMTHLIRNDLGGVLKKLAGTKADPVTILENRTVDVTAGTGGAVDVSILDVRRYGGDKPRSTDVMRRTAQYRASIGPDGKRVPSGEPLVDAGEGGLAEVPSTAVAPGQSWTFTRNVLVDRDLGQGAVTYTDTLSRIDTRAGHRIAVIDVKGKGRVDVAQDLKAKGFQTTDMTLAGSAEFDLTTGLPGAQHYTAHAQWNAKVLWVHIGLIFDDTYDASAWTVKDR
jgi:hypothetical protein